MMMILTIIKITIIMKKHSEETQTLRAGCSKADPHTHRQGRLQYTAQLSAQCINTDSNKCIT